MPHSRERLLLEHWRANQHHAAAVSMGAPGTTVAVPVADCKTARFEGSNPDQRAALGAPGRPTRVHVLARRRGRPHQLLVILPRSRGKNVELLGESSLVDALAGRKNADRPDVLRARR